MPKSITPASTTPPNTSFECQDNKHPFPWPKKLISYLFTLSSYGQRYGFAPDCTTNQPLLFHSRHVEMRLSIISLLQQQKHPRPCAAAHTGDGHSRTSSGVISSSRTSTCWQPQSYRGCPSRTFGSPGCQQLRTWHSYKCRFLNPTRRKWPRSAARKVR